MHAFSNQHPWPPSLQPARPSLRGDKLDKVSHLCQHIAVSRNPPARRRLSAQLPPTPLSITIPIHLPSDPHFLPICLNLHDTAGPLPPIFLFATIQGTRNHNNQHPHQHFTSVAGSSNFAPRNNGTSTQSGIRFFFLYKDPFFSPMSTCVETQTVELHQLDNMAGLQKHPRTKAAASRYICFPLVF